MISLRLSVSSLLLMESKEEEKKDKYFCFVFVVVRSSGRDQKELGEVN